MKKISIHILILFTYLCINHTYGQSTRYEWVSAGGGSRGDTGQEVEVGASGKIYTLVTLSENAVIDNQSFAVSGESDLYLICYNTDGSIDWRQRISNAKPASAWEYYDMDLDASENIYLTGSFDESSAITFNPDDTSPVSENSQGVDFFMAKYNSSGNLLWVKTSGNSGDEGSYAIAVDNNQNVYLSGRFATTLSFPSGPTFTNDLGTRDGFIAKYNQSGDFVWARQLSSNDRFRCYEIGVNSKNEVYGVGEVVGTVGNIKIQTSNTSGLVAVSLSEALDDDGFIIAYDANGNLVHQNFMDEGGSERVYDIVFDENDNYYLTGHFKGNLLTTGLQSSTIDNQDLFVLKYTTNHNIAWFAKDGVFCQNRGQGIALDPLNNVYVTGFWIDAGASCDFAFSGAYDTNDIQMYIAKYDGADGSRVWRKTIGGSQAEYGNDIDVDADNNVYATGRYRQSFSLDNINLPSTEEASYLLAKIDQSIEVGEAVLEGTDFEASSLFAGDEVIIYGNFQAPSGTSSPSTTVKLDDIVVENPQVVSDSEISFTVPAGLSRKEYTLTVTSNGFTSNEYPILIDPYCRSEPSFSETYTIREVSLKTYTNTSGDICNGYSYQESGVELLQGESAEINISVGICDGEIVSPVVENKALKIFIDWNVDNDFADEGEMVAVEDGIGGTSQTLNLNINVPADAQLGNKRMRIVYYQIADAANLNSCYQADAGETEDYMVNVRVAEDISVVGEGFASTVLDDEYPGARDIAHFDKDEDGEMDLLVGYRDADRVSLLENDENEFDEDLVISNSQLVAQPQAVDVADLDADGTFDYLIASFNSSNVLRIEDNTQSQFTAYGASLVESHDLDGDGFEDILISAQHGQDFENGVTEEDGSIFIIYNENGNFQENNAYQLPIPNIGNPRGTHVADVDDDGLPDIIYFSKDNNSTAGNDDQIGWLRNQGDGTFGQLQVIADSESVIDPRAIFAADLQGNGLIDLIVASPVSGILYYLNNGTGFSQSPVAIDAGENAAFDIVVTDMDGDGKQDIVAAFTDDNRISWYKNNSSAQSISFGESQLIYENPASDPRFTFVHTVDLDGDGDQDVISADQLKNEVLWLENELTDTPTPLLLSLSTGEGEAGDEIVLTGSFFGSSVHPDVIEVMFGDLMAEIISVTDGGTRITVRVPEASSTTATNVSVNLVRNSTSSSALAFTINVDDNGNGNDDTTDPEISLQGDGANRRSNFNDSFTISIQASDPESDLSNLEVEFVGITEEFTNNFTDVSGFDPNQSVNEWLSPQSAGDEMGVKYQFRVTNSAGLNATTEGVTYWDYDLSINDVANPVTEPEQSDYQVIALPFERQSVSDALGSVTYDKETWRLFRAEPTNNYAEFGSSGFNAFEQGEGYWLLAKTNTLDRVSGSIAPLADNGEITIPVTQGWNAIGNPFPFDIDWESVVSRNSGLLMNSGSLRLFRNGDFNDNISNLRKFEGGWVNAAESGQLVISVEDRSGAISGKFADLTETQKKSFSWLLPLDIRSEGKSVQQLSLGMHLQASTERDFYDADVFPGFFHPAIFGFQRQGFEFSKDIVPEDEFAEWTLSTIENSGNQALTLHWNTDALQKLKKGLWLFDESQIKLVDMLSSSNFQIRNDKGSTIRILYGSREEVLQSILQNEMTAGMAFPNPASNRFTLPLMIPENQSVSAPIYLKIFNSQGQQVGSYQFDELPAGYHELDIKLAENLKSGLYFYQIASYGRETYLSRESILIK